MYFFYKFIFKPEINFFLHAPSKIILERKQELDSKSIDYLNKEYKELFHKMSKNNAGKYFCVENINLNETLEKIFKILEKHDKKNY